MGETRFIVAGNLLDGSGGEVRRQIFLAVEGGIITAIGPAAELPRRPGTVVDDLSHCNLLPPLVDCSVTLTQSPSVDRLVRSTAEEGGLTEKSEMLARHSRYCQTYGVLGVADGDDPLGLVAASREKLTADGLIELRTSGPLCRDGEDCAADRPTGPDFLKIAYSPDIESPEAPNPQLSREDLCHLLQRRDGRQAVVLANGRQQVAEALAAGCDAIEQGYDMGEDNLRTMAEHQVLWIPGALRARNGLDGASGGGEVACRFSIRYVAPGQPNPGAEAFWQKTLANQLAQLRLARKLGVPTAVGTGAGSVGILHGESMVEEMKLFIKAGYTLTETIRCASANGAKFFGMARLGPLTIGRPATFLIARGSVQQLPRKLAYLEGIYVDGIPSPTYRKNPGQPPRPKP